MYDALIASNIPRFPAPDIVAGYVDGKAWSQADWDLFPRSIKVGISAAGTDAGTVLDCEPGNPNAAQSVDWVLARRAAGIDPTVYVAQWAPGYTMNDVLSAHIARGVVPPHVWYAPGQNETIPLGCVAVQFGYVGPYDISAVADYWPGVDPPPISARGGFEMFLFRDDDTGAEYLVAEKSVVYLGDPATVALYAQALPTSHGHTADVAKIKATQAQLWPTT
jgi:hypothetical protein